MELTLLCLGLLVVLPVHASNNEAVQRFNQRISTSPRNAPLLPTTLTYAWDGPSRLIHDPELFWNFNQLINRQTYQEIIETGKRAVRFHQRQYGVDLSRVPDEVLLGRGNYTSYDGSFTFTTGVIDPTTFYRVISFSGPDFAIKMNNPVAEGFWYLIFNKEFAARGKVNAILPPATFGLWGFQAIHVNESAEEGKYLPPPNGPILTLLVKSLTAFYPPHPLTGALAINDVIADHFLGEGNLRGSLMPMVDSLDDVNDDTHYSGKWSASFPGAIPFPPFPEFNKGPEYV